MEIYALINPYARFGHTLKIVKPLVKHLSRAGMNHRIKLIKAGDKIEEIIQYLDDKYNYLLVIGGDGTVNSAAKAILKHEKKHVLATFLGGTGGELARHVNITTMKALVESLKIGKTENIDTFKVDVELEHGREKHVIVANLQIGHFSLSIRETPLKLKKIFGSNGYMVGVIKGVLKRKNKQTRVIGDGKQIFSGKTFTIHLGNLKTTRGGIHVTPLAKPNDEKIDMLLARAIGKIEAFKTLPKVLEGKHLTHPAVIYGQFKKMEIETEGDHIAIDGEYLGKTAKIEVEYYKKLRLLTNRNNG